MNAQLKNYSSPALSYSYNAGTSVETEIDINRHFYQEKLSLFLYNNTIKYNRYILDKYIDPYKSYLPLFLLLKNLIPHDSEEGRMLSGRLIGWGQDLSVVKGKIPAQARDHSILWVCPPNKQLIHYIIIDDLEKSGRKIDAKMLRKVYTDYLDRMYFYPAPRDPQAFWKELVIGLADKINALPHGPDAEDWKEMEGYGAKLMC